MGLASARASRGGKCPYTQRRRLFRREASLLRRTRESHCMLRVWSVGVLFVSRMSTLQDVQVRPHGSSLLGAGGALRPSDEAEATSFLLRSILEGRAELSVLNREARRGRRRPSGVGREKASAFASCLRLLRLVLECFFDAPIVSRAESCCLFEAPCWLREKGACRCFPSRLEGSAAVRCLVPQTEKAFQRQQGVSRLKLAQATKRKGKVRYWRVRLAAARRGLVGSELRRGGRVASAPPFSSDERFRKWGWVSQPRVWRRKEPTWTRSAPSRETFRSEDASSSEAATPSEAKPPGPGGGAADEIEEGGVCLSFCFRGMVVSTKMKRCVVIRRTYLHFIRKYSRVEKRHKNVTCHLSPCFDQVKEGDIVTAGQCR